MVAISPLAENLNFNAFWTLNLGSYVNRPNAVLSSVDDPSATAAFLGSGIWGQSIGKNANFSLVNDPITGVPSIRVNYPKNSFKAPQSSSPNLTASASVPTGPLPSTGMGGAQFYARPFPKNPAQRALLEYDVYFAPNFPFNLGGKLPGLYGSAAGSLPSEACVGGYEATGTNCWSMRLMWRAYGAGEAYAYIPASNKANVCDPKKFPNNVCVDFSDYGLSFGRKLFTFQAGTWNRVAIHVQVNDVGGSNGFVQVYYNNSKVIEVPNLTFRTSVPMNSLLVSDIIFSTFFGGASAEWAAPSDTFAMFKNLNLSISNDKYQISANAAHVQYTQPSYLALMLFLMYYFMML